MQKSQLLKSAKSLSHALIQDHEVEQIIFPLSLSQGVYNLSEYTPGMTNEKLSKNDVENFFYQIYENTEYFENVKPGPLVKKIIIIILVFLLLFCACLGGIITIFLKEKPDVSNAPKALRILAIALIIMSIVLAIAFFIVIVRYTVVINRNNRDARNKIQEVINAENTSLEIVGIRWALPNGHYNWIELWNEPRIKRPMNTSSPRILRKSPTTMTRELESSRMLMRKSPTLVEKDPKKMSNAEPMNEYQAL